MQVATVLEERIGHYSAEILAFLRRRAPRDAEELAQETWLRVASANPRCADERAFRAYAFTVARRLLIDHHRRASARIQLVGLPGGLEPAVAGASDPHGDAAAAQTLAVVEAALDAMKPELAQVFRWRTCSQLSFKQIALRQGVPLNTALGRMHHATRRISAALSARGLLPDGGPR